MNPSYWMFGMMLAVTGAAYADADVSGNDLGLFARASAQDMPGARESVGREADGTVKWAGVWMEKEKTCPNGHMGDDGRRLVTRSGRFAADHGARLILFAPRADMPAMEHDATTTGTRVEVRANDQIGEHCYLVIRR